MKHRLLFLIVLIAFPVCARAQYSSTLVDPSGYLPSAPAIYKVCNWGGDSIAVSYCIDNGGCFYAINYAPHLASTSSPNYHLYRLGLPASVHSVNDFCIVDNWLFFCGYSDSGNCCMGFLDMQDFVGGNPTSFEVRKLATDVMQVYRIAAYRRSASVYDAYMLGYSWAPGSQFYSIVEAKDVLSGTTHTVAVLPFDAATAQCEMMDEIVVTQNYINFVGRDNYTNTGHIVFRRLDKGQGLANVQMQTLYRLDAVSEYNSRIYATFYRRDRFAVAYSHCMNAATGTYNAYVRTVDAMFLANANSQRFPTEGKGELLDIAYSREADRFVVLHPHGGLARFVMLDPHGTSIYSTQTMYSTTDAYNYMAAIPSGHLVATSVGKWAMLQVPTASMSSACFNYSTSGVKQTNNLSVVGSVTTPYPNCSPEVLFGGSSNSMVNPTPLDIPYSCEF